ncbi:myeloid-associated differentiation marker homolog [Sphaeramia orbicularis]|uniref:Myeloid-associated differentiation marker homolog n=1 Tax=Sphaeramia orbicularis TaxID=375764 RepID=A0A673AHP9_9TELE|nr:myeloid-associated differentiation marker homolog [Sphaeramia orbicularis]
MITLNFKACTAPVGIVRILEVVFTFSTFILAAVPGILTLSLWTRCMLTWCFCFAITLLILLLEFTSVSTKLPISWNDFIAAFAMLASLLVLSASIIYPVYSTCSKCGRQIGATVTSYVAFILYVVEVWLTRAKPDEISGFTSTVPGLLKVLEVYIALIIFSCLNLVPFSSFPGLQWCAAVYCICFIFAALIIIFTICRLTDLLPAPFDKVLKCCNVFCVLMYVTAVVMWPFYSFKHYPQRDEYCTSGQFCSWDVLVFITFMTCFNLVAHIVDTLYSFRLLFFVSQT